MNTKPFSLKQDNNGSQSLCKLSSKAALMCPKCYNIIRIKQCGEIEAANENDGEYIDLLVRPSYHIDCPICHEFSEAISLDYLMADSISILNKAGYLTEMCCNSHDNESSIENMFIKFRSNYMFRNLPEGFEMYDGRLKPVNLNMTRGQAMENIEAWAAQFIQSRVSNLLSKASGDISIE